MLKIFMAITFAIISALTCEGRECEREITFSSQGVELSGILCLPKNDAPKALIIAVHGAGTAEYMLPVSRLLASEGFAVFYYDKRGVGKSDGTYVGIGNTSADNLELLAHDAAAALQSLSKIPSLSGLYGGFIGISQAGWVIPIASQKSNPDFIALWSGPVCTTSEEQHFSNLAENDPDFWDSHSKQEVAEYMKTVQYANDDVDPLVSLQHLNIPGLWLYGGRDISIPVDLSVANLIELKRNGKSTFEFQVFPNEGHNLVYSPQQKSFQAMVIWLNETIKTLNETKLHYKSIE